MTDQGRRETGILRDWDAFDDEARHVMTCLAALSRLSNDAVVSHASAAAFWGLPRIGPWPGRVHVTDPRVERGSTGRYVSRHAGDLQPQDVSERHGVLVTSAGRTLANLALRAPFRQSVVALDHALRIGMVGLGDVRLSLSGRAAGRGQVKAATALDFADARANRPGESLSRVVMREARIRAPELQHSFAGPNGQNADVDFFWSDVGVVGEFDGEKKYRDSERWSGLSPEDVVIREKDRENWIRALPRCRRSCDGPGATR